MLKLSRSPVVRYAIALLAVALAALIRSLLDPLFPDNRFAFALFYAAVMAAAWYGGLGPGLAAIVLSVLAADYFWMAPVHSFAIAYREDRAGLGQFVVATLVIALFSEGLQRAGRRVEASAASLKESEERYRRIVETTTEGVWLIDAEMRTEYVNQRMAEMLGSTVEEMLNTSMLDFIHYADREEARRNFEQSKAGTTRAMDLRLLRKDGSVIWAIVSSNAILNRDGEFVGMLGMLADVTERKRAEEDRAELLVREWKARREAELATRAKDEFLATVSHELRSPLNAILGWAHILRMQQCGELAFADGLEIIESNARSQAQLIEDLLDVSRIVSGKFRLDVRPVELTSIVNAVLAAVRPMADVKSIRLQTSLDPAVGPISGDSHRLQQVIWNLLANAIKFTPHGGEVTVSVRRLGNNTQIAVTDSGQGISPDLLPCVFDRFRQADGASAKRHDGLGLGLAIVRHIVELHGGTVLAHSEGEGKGATFTAELPLSAVRTE